MYTNMRHKAANAFLLAMRATEKSIALWSIETIVQILTALFSFLWWTPIWLPISLPYWGQMNKCFLIYSPFTAFERNHRC